MICASVSRLLIRKFAIKFWGNARVLGFDWHESFACMYQSSETWLTWLVFEDLISMEALPSCSAVKYQGFQSCLGRKLCPQVLVQFCTSDPAMYCWNTWTVMLVYIHFLPLGSCMDHNGDRFMWQGCRIKWRVGENVFAWQKEQPSSTGVGRKWQQCPLVPVWHADLLDGCARFWLLRSFRVFQCLEENTQTVLYHNALDDVNIMMACCQWGSWWCATSLWQLSQIKHGRMAFDWNSRTWSNDCDQVILTWTSHIHQNKHLSARAGRAGTKAV